MPHPPQSGLPSQSGSGTGLFFLDFVYLLREHEIPVGIDQVLDFFSGLERGLAITLDELYLFARLCFVKRVELFDTYHRIFALYFQGVDLPALDEGDPELLYSKQFKQWLEAEIAAGRLTRQALWKLSREELMKRFWETVRQQQEAHQGGSRWVGIGGTSPYGHSGFSAGGIRVMGPGGNRGALKVIGDRRYIAYDGHRGLSGENIRQVLGTLKQLLPAGARSELNLDETIYQTARNGGEIEWVFRQEKLDRIKLLLLIDNGGTSMLPHVELTQLLFSKVRDRFKDFRAYFFHNSIYDHIYSDAPRRKAVAIERLLELPADTRVFIVGDASMAPQELMTAYGSISFDAENLTPSIEQLRRLRKRFPFSVWLNPIPMEEWAGSYGSWTIQKIAEIFRMEDLTLNGIKRAVTFLREKGK